MSSNKWCEEQTKEILRFYVAIKIAKFCPLMMFHLPKTIATNKGDNSINNFLLVIYVREQ
jgi:hypothetical protein